ncbi:MAG: diguanylate cyclase [Vulcanibacillus sp.]
MIEYNMIYSAICLASSILILSLGLISLLHYRSHSAKPLGILMFFAGIYSFGYAFEIIQGDPSWTFFWIRIEYLGVSFIAATSLWLSFEFTGKVKYLKKSFYFLSYGISVFFLITFFANIAISQNDLLSTAELSNSILYIAHSIWLFSCLTLSLMLYIHYYIRSSLLLKRQALIMIIGSTSIVSYYFIYLLGFIPWDINIGPVAFAINGTIYAYAIFRVKLSDISPIARDKVFESMDEGIIITDLYDIIVDYNSYAIKVFPDSPKNWLGESLFQLSSEFGSLHTLDSSKSKAIRINDSDGVQYYHIKRISVFDKKRNKLGYAWYIKKITEQYKLMEKLKEYAEKDELTGIWNRRKWLELATYEIERSKRYKGSISLMIIDADHFKYVNDTLGHEAGDKTLITISNIVSKEIRNGDIFGRIGGEEFGIVFLETNRAEVQALSQRLLTSISNTKIEFEETIFSVSVSAGIVMCEDCSELSIKELMRKADIALYKAKETGRNKDVFA